MLLGEAAPLAIVLLLATHGFSVNGLTPGKLLLNDHATARRDPGKGQAKAMSVVYDIPSIQLKTNAVQVNTAAGASSDQEMIALR